MFRHKQLENVLCTITRGTSIKVEERRKGEVFKLCYIQKCSGKPHFGRWSECN